MRRRRCLVACTSLMCAGCSYARSDVGTPAPAIRVLTDSASYSLAPPYSRTTVQVRVVNVSRDTVVLAHCGEVVAVQVQRLEGAQWRRIDPGICATVRIPPQYLPPGASERFPVRLYPGPGVNVEALVGTLRIIVEATALRPGAEGTPNESELPVAERATAPFTVRQEGPR